MSDQDPILLDVRPTIAAGEDPFDAIMAAVDRLEPGQELILANSFEPFPLYAILEERGFERSVERFPNGDWRITFRKVRVSAEDGRSSAARGASPAVDADR